MTLANFDVIQKKLDEEFECQHPDMPLAFRTYAGRPARHYSRQCQICGFSTDLIKHAELTEREMAAAVPFDENLRKAWWKCRQIRQQEIRSELLQERSTQRRDEYAEYLATDQWHAKRAAIMRRDQGQCQARYPGCTGRATAVHHKTYEHIFDEPLFDLVAVCSFCHSRLHSAERNGHDD